MDLMARLPHLDRDQRVSLHQALQHPFITVSHQHPDGSDCASGSKYHMRLDMLMAFFTDSLIDRHTDHLPSCDERLPSGGLSRQGEHLPDLAESPPTECYVRGPSAGSSDDAPLPTFSLKFQAHLSMLPSFFRVVIH